MSATLTFRYAGPAFGGPKELRFGPGGPRGPEATKKFAVRLASPTTVDIRWVSGPITLASLTLATASGVSDDVTVSVNGVAVDGWDNLTNDTTPTTYPPASPVTLEDGDLLTIASISGGSGLSLGFSE